MLDNVQEAEESLEREATWEELAEAVKSEEEEMIMMMIIKDRKVNEEDENNTWHTYLNTAIY